MVEIIISFLVGAGASGLYGVYYFSDKKEELERTLDRTIDKLTKGAALQVSEAEKKQAESSKRELNALQKKVESKVQDLPLNDLINVFINRLSTETNSDALIGDKHSQYLDLYNALIKVFSDHKILSPEKLHSITQDVHRINQIETLIDLYSEKIRRAKRDDDLDEDERETKVAYWQRLMDKEISDLEDNT